MSTDTQGEPRFSVLDYITISRDPRTGLVVAVGGEERAAGILQHAGGFVSAPGPRGPYHRLPHTMAPQQQRQGATAAAHQLLLAGYSVHLDPSLNTLLAPDGDRAAAHRYLGDLAERAAGSDQEAAAVLTEIAAPVDGVLARTVQVLTTTWFTWAQRQESPGPGDTTVGQLQEITREIARGCWRIEQVRHHLSASRARTPATPAPASPSPPSPECGPPTKRR